MLINQVKIINKAIGNINHITSILTVNYKLTKAKN